MEDQTISQVSVPSIAKATGEVRYPVTIIVSLLLLELLIAWYAGDEDGGMSYYISLQALMFAVGYAYARRLATEQQASVYVALYYYALAMFFIFLWGFAYGILSTFFIFDDQQFLSGLIAVLLSLAITINKFKSRAVDWKRFVLIATIFILIDKLSILPSLMDSMNYKYATLFAGALMFGFAMHYVIVKDVLKRMHLIKS